MNFFGGTIGTIGTIGIIDTSLRSGLPAACDVAGQQAELLIRRRSPSGRPKKEKKIPNHEIQRGDQGKIDKFSNGPPSGFWKKLFFHL